MFKESNLVKIITSLPHFSKSHPKNKIILIYDDEHEKILYADHFEKKQGIVPDLRLSYTGTDYKTSIKNDLNFDFCLLVDTISSTLSVFEEYTVKTLLLKL